MKILFVFILVFIGFNIINAQCDSRVFKTQTEIDSFSCSGPIGNLFFIDDNDGIDPITTLLPLRVKGYNIVNGSMIIENCHQLKSLDGIDVLDSVGHTIRILNNDSLTIFNIDTLNFPFHIKHIDSALIIENNKALEVINGLDSLFSPLIRISISNNDSLETIESFDQLEKLQSFTLKNNDHFNKPISFPILNTINDSLIIVENNNLQNCAWIRLMIKIAAKNKQLIENNGPNCNLEIEGDRESPGYANCPEPSEIINIGGECTGVHSFIDPFVTDNILVESYNVTIISSKGEVIGQREAVSGMNFMQSGFTLGLNEINYEAIDEAGNIGTCQAIVNLIDIEPPFISEDLEDVTINTITQNCVGRYSIVFPAVVENCSVTDSRIEILNESTLDTVFNTQAIEGENYNIDLGPGQYLINIIVSDESALSDISSASITVIDENVVEITNCLLDTIIASDESCYNTYTYTSPQLMGNCGNSMILREIVSETGSIIQNGLILPNTEYTDTFPEGENQLIFRFINGVNSVMCSNNVTAAKRDLPGVILTAEDVNCTTYKGKIIADVDTIEGSYSWSGPNGFTSDSLENDVDFPGFYVFTLIQENGCRSEYGVNVFQGDSNVDISITLGEINCEEGYRIVTIDEDLIDFQYRWTGPDSFSADVISPIISSAGWYYAEVEGDFGCYGIDSILIEHDIKYDYDLMIDGSTAEILINGGTPPFIFKWDDEINDTLITDLENGTHHLRIVDGLGCIVDIPFEIMVSSIDQPEINTIRIFPNPTTDEIRINGIFNGKAILYNSQGYVMRIINETPSISMDIKNWPSGIYYLKVMDSDKTKVVKFLKI